MLGSVLNTFIYFSEIYLVRIVGINITLFCEILNIFFTIERDMRLRKTK